MAAFSCINTRRETVSLAPRHVSRPRAAVIYDCLFPISGGGGERVYRRLAELLVERGYVVDYLTRLQWDVKDGPPAATFSIIAIWHGNINDESGTRTGSAALAFGFSCLTYLMRRRQRYDIVICSALPASNVIFAGLALAGGRSYLVTDWLEVWGRRKWRSYAGSVVGLLGWSSQWLAAKMGDLQTVNSHFSRERLQRYSTKPAVVLGLLDLVEVPGIGRSVAGSRHAEPPAPSLGDAEPGWARFPARYALFVGRHIADKNLETLVDALAWLRRLDPSVELVIVGSGPTTALAARRAEFLGWRGRSTSSAGSLRSALGRSIRMRSCSPIRHGARGLASSSPRRLRLALPVSSCAARTMRRSSWSRRVSTGRYPNRSCRKSWVRRCTASSREVMCFARRHLSGLLQHGQPAT